MCPPFGFGHTSLVSPPSIPSVAAALHVCPTRRCAKSAGRQHRTHCVSSPSGWLLDLTSSPRGQERYKNRVETNIFHVGPNVGWSRRRFEEKRRRFAHADCLCAMWGCMHDERADVGQFAGQTACLLEISVSLCVCLSLAPYHCCAISLIALCASSLQRARPLALHACTCHAALTRMRFRLSKCLVVGAVLAASAGGWFSLVDTLSALTICCRTLLETVDNKQA